MFFSTTGMLKIFTYKKSINEINENYEISLELMEECFFTDNALFHGKCHGHQIVN